MKFIKSHGRNVKKIINNPTKIFLIFFEKSTKKSKGILEYLHSIDKPKNTNDFFEK
ncbi:hypothetical protein MSIBF_A3180001 [groundwater metagenome]|uniref:Transposase n=1 Tax=groundwater metagenome TaxID=717931 RepID=A0A098EC27_9ZZZZ